MGRGLLHLTGKGAAAAGSGAADTLPCSGAHSGKGEGAELQCWSAAAVLSASDLRRHDRFGEGQQAMMRPRGCLHTGLTPRLTLLVTLPLIAGKQQCYVEAQLGNGSSRTRTCKGNGRP